MVCDGVLIIIGILEDVFFFNNGIVFVIWFDVEFSKYVVFCFGVFKIYSLFLNNILIFIKIVLCKN